MSEKLTIDSSALDSVASTLRTAARTFDQSSVHAGNSEAYGSDDVATAVSDATGFRLSVAEECMAVLESLSSSILVVTESFERADTTMGADTSIREPPR